MEFVDPKNDVAFKKIFGSEELAREEGREEGLQKGREEEKHSLIFNMHKNGMSVEQIATITGLSIDEIKAITE